MQVFHVCQGHMATVTKQVPSETLKRHKNTIVEGKRKLLHSF